MADHIKQDSATTAEHSKQIIDLLKKIRKRFLLSVLYGIIHMAVLIITDVLQHYTYCQYYRNHLI